LRAIVLAAEPVRIRDLSKRVPKQAAAVPPTSGKRSFIGLTEGALARGDGDRGRRLPAHPTSSARFANRLVYEEQATPCEVLSRIAEHVREPRRDIVMQMWRLLGRLIHEFEGAA
jgi:hypothetical protein